MKKNIKGVKSHFIPQFNLKYWKNNGGKMFDKTKNTFRDFSTKNSFYIPDYYVFDGSSNYEKRLGAIENYMSILLKKIENNTEKIELSKKDIRFIQLFLFLQGSRHTNTTEVILSDESENYESNNYLFGLENIVSEKDREDLTKSLINAIEGLLKNKENEDLRYWITFQCETTHLNIVRSNDNYFCISDVSVLIENDIDSNFLFAYFPQTPKTSFMIIKSKYFYSIDKMYKKFHGEYPSMILREESVKLICQYKVESISEFGQMIKEANLSLNNEKMETLEYINFSINKIDEFNKIFFDDGEKFIFTQNEKYIDELKSVTTPYRGITITF